MPSGSDTPVINCQFELNTMATKRVFRSVDILALLICIAIHSTAGTLTFDPTTDPTTNPTTDPTSYPTANPTWINGASKMPHLGYGQIVGYSSSNNSIYLLGMHLN